ncbi:hypothetical protein PIB30_060626 [Stylosanthes scabra]|uniref:Uncharacterized protein n=1 Tax=Stylosanthes scabra TaxID=79078 RepID=A0ABU6YJI1_9FABA|nr:hypothetical protein [Stylosanthes scabra]
MKISSHITQMLPKQGSIASGSSDVIASSLRSPPLPSTSSQPCQSFSLVPSFSPSLCVNNRRRLQKADAVSDGNSAELEGMKSNPIELSQSKQFHFFLETAEVSNYTRELEDIKIVGKLEVIASM